MLTTGCRTDLTLVNLPATIANMGTRAVSRGPTAETVAANVRRLREARGLSLPGLSDRLAKIGRPILPSGLSKIELGERRVDVDDLMALAVALRVNPSAMLLPHTTGSDESYEITGAGGLPAHQVWDWADGKAPLFDPDDDATDLDFLLHARPPGRRTWRYLPGRDMAETMRRAMPEDFDWSQFRVRDFDQVRDRWLDWARRELDRDEGGD